MNLMQASNQWLNRPDEERFWTLREMYEQCLNYFDSAMTKPVFYGDLNVVCQDDSDELYLTGKSNVPARLSHYAMSQLCSRVHAPANYLRRLPTKLAAANLQTSLILEREPEDEAVMLIHQDQDYLIRCITSDRYRRIWNHEIIARLFDLEDAGWKVPPSRPSPDSEGRTREATEADCLSSGKFGLSIKPGDIIGPGGLYAGDRDMFVFMVDDKHVVENPASPGVPLGKGFFISNSEVGDRSFSITTFLYDHVCGNHIVWGAQQIQEMKIRHVGSAKRKAFGNLNVELRRYADESTSELEKGIARSQRYEIAATKEETLDAVIAFAKKKKLNTLNDGNLSQAWDLADVRGRYGNPNTPWALSQALTEISQDAQYTSNRVMMDREAGKLIGMAF